MAANLVALGSALASLGKFKVTRCPPSPAWFRFPLNNSFLCGRPRRPSRTASSGRLVSSYTFLEHQQGPSPCRTVPGLRPLTTNQGAKSLRVSERSSGLPPRGREGRASNVSHHTLNSCTYPRANQPAGHCQKLSWGKFRIS